MFYISKTDYLLWRECPKNAWLKLHRPDVFYADEPSEFDLALIEAGNEVEFASRGLFPGGLQITGARTETLVKTRNLIATGSAVLFQAAFETKGLFAAIDVLKLDPATGEYALYEVKSSTKTKLHHLYDLAFQVILLRESGLKVGRAYLTHLNSAYERSGDLDAAQLFVSDDVIQQVEHVVSEVSKELCAAQACLASDTEPKGSCACVYKGRSQHCSTFRYSNPHIPEYSIHDITRIGQSPKALRLLIDEGNFTLDKIPEGMKLSETQRIQTRVFLTGKPVVEKRRIANDLSELNYPYHFIDYETYAPPIPHFDRFSPYDQIPLQYSVHILATPDGEPIHREFMHIGQDDPTSSFLASLKRHIGSFGTIIVWSKSFESHVNDRIADRIPQERTFLAEINDRIYDLKDVFAKQYFVHKALLGKISIKRVLPVLAPELTYANLSIQNGTAASLAWKELLSGDLSSAEEAIFPGEVERVLRAGHLRDVCHLEGPVGSGK